MRRWAPLIVALISMGCFDAHTGERASRDASVDADDGGLPALDAGGDGWFEDTVGWRVRFRCDDARCAAPGFDAPADFPVSCPSEMRPYVATIINGRIPTLLATCHDGRGWFGWTEVARPFVCDADDHCVRLPHLHGRPRCVDGICQVPEEPLHRIDVIAHCMAYVDRPAVALMYPFPPALERAWQLADEACPPDGDVCEVPPECALR